jgi:hypothetical protein
MKRTTGILTSLIAVAALAWGQSPEIIQNTRNKMQTVEKNSTAGFNQALGDKAPSKPTPAAQNAAAKTVASPVKAGSAVPAQAKPAPVQAKSAPAVAAKPAVNAQNTAVKTVGSPVKTGSAAPARGKPAPVQAKSAGTVAAKPVKQAAGAKSAKAPKNRPPAASAASSKNPGASAADEAKKEEQDGTDKKWSMGKRDPFISPVVSHVGGSGCSTGKKCLEIGAINLRGIVRSENGFIAVVTNAMNKAYFLRENDPVFDGYVVKITGDSVTFKEMLQDRLGKAFTREVVKKITTPAV